MKCPFCHNPLTLIASFQNDEVGIDNRYCWYGDCYDCHHCQIKRFGSYHEYITDPFFTANEKEIISCQMMIEYPNKTYKICLNYTENTSSLYCFPQEDKDISSRTLHQILPITPQNISTRLPIYLIFS